MSDSLGPKEDKMEGFKWTLIVLLLVGGVWANSHFEEQVAWALRFTAGILLLLALFGVFLATEKGKAFWSLAKESRVELRKVEWPTRQETVQSTVIVAIMVVLMSLVLWAVDSLLMIAVEFFTG